jgi:ribosomal protein S18 acetylase RimI-like enzyme
MGEAIRIRRATIDDFPDVVRLYISLKEHGAELEPGNLQYQVDDARWEHIARAGLLDNSAACYVAQSNQRTVGFMKLRFIERAWGKGCEIETLIVEEQSRGRGIGTRLMSVAEGEATRRGVVAMRVDVLSKNLRGVRFYEREGYEPFAVRLGKSLRR